MYSQSKQLLKYLYSTAQDECAVKELKERREAMRKPFYTHNHHRNCPLAYYDFYTTVARTRSLKYLDRQHKVGKKFRMKLRMNHCPLSHHKAWQQKLPARSSAHFQKAQQTSSHQMLMAGREDEEEKKFTASGQFPSMPVSQSQFSVCSNVMPASGVILSFLENGWMTVEIHLS